MEKLIIISNQIIIICEKNSKQFSLFFLMGSKQISCKVINTIFCRIKTNQQLHFPLSTKKKKEHLHLHFSQDLNQLDYAFPTKSTCDQRTQRYEL